MEKTYSNFNFTMMEKLLGMMIENHSESNLNKLRAEVNKFFNKSYCLEIIYTNNTDKLFFGMRVYPLIGGNTEAIDYLGEESLKKKFDKYYIELDSKLFDPMLCLDEKELTAILIHEIGHIVYDNTSIDEVKKAVDMYFINSGDNFDFKTYESSKGYRELLAYALKDSVLKIGSIFSKIGNDEIIADSFVAGCGYGYYLESAMKKISSSVSYLNKSTDDRLITLSWVLRLQKDFKLRRLPAIKTLNKAKSLTASKLEEREINYAIDVLNRMDNPVSEGVLDNVRARFSKKFANFKAKGIRSIKDDIYELNLRLRCADTETDLMYIIRTTNSDIAILRDYLTEDIPDQEREDILKVLEELYDIRQRAAKNKEVNKYDSLIQVVYPEM